MTKQRTVTPKFFLLTLVVLAIGALLALAGSQGGMERFGVPVFALAVAAAFVVQWVAFAVAYALQSEKFYDTMGSVTYLLITVVILALAPELDVRAWLLGAMVILWALRLGIFLTWRAHRFGGDDRFDDIKPDFARFLFVWTTQGLWVTFTAMAAWIAIGSDHRPALGWLGVVGVAVWLIGFAIEVVADLQKTRFKLDDANRGRFIAHGLWAWSRHPNYFGEIMLWAGVALVAAGALQGWQWVAMLSPLFVAALLTRVSGIPLLEKKAEAKWGDDPEYRAYRERTSVLVPLPPQR